MQSFLAPLRRRAALIGLALVFLTCAATVRADDPPTFSDPEVTAFAREYSKFMDDYSAFMKEYLAALKANDATKAEAVSKRSVDFDTRGQNLQAKALAVQGKVKAEEAQKFSDYMDACSKRMTESMQ